MLLLWTQNMDNSFCVFIFIFAMAGLTFAENNTADRGIILTSGNYQFGQPYKLFGLSAPPPSNATAIYFPGITFSDRLFYSCDIDVRRNLIYLYDVRHSSIVAGNNFNMSLNEDNMNFTTEHHVVSTRHVKVAVDWVSHNVYWTDPVLGAIMMQPGTQYNERSLYRIIVREHLDRPSGIALDPISGYLFWTDSSKSSCIIERSSLIGQNRTLVIAIGLHKLNAITADVIEKRIYFTKDGYIESATYDGGDRKHLFRNMGSIFFDVALFQGVVIATDTFGYLYYLSKAGSHIRNVRISVNGICVYDSDQQPITATDRCTTAGCEDICVNEPDKATCLCRTGFELQSNQKNCQEAAGEYHRAILVNNGTHLCLLSMIILSYKDSNTVECFYQHNTSEQISYTDVNMEQREVYFATQKFIYRVPIDTNNADAIQIAPKGVDNEDNGNNITGLSYDWVNNDLYWSQTDPDGVFVINLDTDDVLQVTHSNNTFSPRDVLVVPHAQKLFWISNSENEPTIKTASLSGGNASIQRLVTRQKLHNLIRIYHDVKYEQLSILDYSETSYDVVYINYTGVEMQNFAISETMGDCALYQDLLLFMTVDVYNNTILYSRDRLAISSPTSLGTIDDIGLVISMSVIDVGVLQPTYHSPCGEQGFKSAGCNQICIPHREKAECLCEIGFTLLNDEKTCHSAPLEDNFILATEDIFGKLFQLPLNNPAEIQGIEIANVGMLQSILYNTITNKVVWVQAGSSNVFTSSLDGKTKKLADIDMFRGKPTKFALDGTTGNIYFTGYREKAEHRSDSSPSANLIGVISPSGDTNIVYDGDVNKAWDIVLHPQKGLMFWTDAFSRIMRAGMDGSDVKAIAAGGKRYYSLAIDYSEEYLYWYEAYKTNIYRSDLDGNDVRVFYTDTGDYKLRLKLLGEYLYYTGQNRVQVTRLNKHNISDVTRLGPNAGIGVFKDFDVYSSNDSLLVPKNKACSDKNGNCSHFCLPNSRGGRTCACPYGFALQTDKKTCNGTMCPKVIPNGQLPEDCIPKIGVWCNNFTCNQGYVRSKAVSSLICNESGLWNYDLSMLCIEAEKSTQTRLLVIAIGAGFGLLVFISSIVIVICVLYRKGKLRSKPNDISSDLPSSLDDSGIADTSLNYIDHLSWLRTRINQFLILDEDADKAFIAPGERHQ